MSTDPHPGLRALNGIDALPWTELKHNYGTAEDIPDLLRAVAAGDGGGRDSDEAFDELTNNLYHQGGWICSAATAALPYLLALAAVPTVTRRVELAEFVEQLVGEAAVVQDRFLDPGWTDAWARSRSAVVALLQDATPGIRRAAMASLAVAAEPVVATLALLQERWERDEDQPTRLAALATLGRAAANAPSDAAVQVRALLEELLADDRPSVRLAAVHALGLLDPEAPARHLDLLVEALSTHDIALDMPEVLGGPRLAGLVMENYAPLAERPVAASSFVVRLADPSRPQELRRAALDRAGMLLSRWRSPAVELLPVLMESLEASDPEIRVRAAHLLAALGPGAAPAADRLAARLTDHGALGARRIQQSVADNALWALTRLDDPRCLPGLVGRLHSRGKVFAPHGSHYSPSFLYYPTLPGMHEVLIPLGAHADLLLPELRALLRRVLESGDGETARACVNVLAGWGTAALPALPELIRSLDDAQLMPHAVEALGGMGTTAAAAIPELRRARARVPEGTRATATQLQALAWAGAQLGDDARPALRLLSDALSEERVFHVVMRRLGDLGPSAVAQAARLRQLQEEASPSSWERVQASIALWKVTGDPELALPALEETVRPLADGRFLPVMHRALEGLAAIGRLGDETRAALECALTLDLRLMRSGSWRAFTEDEETRWAVRTLLDATG